MLFKSLPYNLELIAYLLLKQSQTEKPSGFFRNTYPSHTCLSLPTWMLFTAGFREFFI